MTRAADPSGMFVQSHGVHPTPTLAGNGNGGKCSQSDLSIYGQESNYTTWRTGEDEPSHPGH